MFRSDEYFLGKLTRAQICAKFIIVSMFLISTLSRKMNVNNSKEDVARIGTMFQGALEEKKPT